MEMLGHIKEQVAQEAGFENWISLLRVTGDFGKEAYYDKVIELYQSYHLELVKHQLVETVEEVFREHAYRTLDNYAGFFSAVSNAILNFKPTKDV